MEQLRMICKMQNIPPFEIEDGFTIRMYEPGDEVVWTEISKNGLLEEGEGIECWDKYMLSIKALVPERDVFFVVDAKGNAVATCTAFVQDDGVGLMHMLAAKPEARGHHLGWAMTTYTLNKLAAELPKDNPMVRLKSDDWRLPALSSYLKAGFQPVLFDVDMDKRWKEICDKLNFPAVEMLDDNGNPTGVIIK